MGEAQPIRYELLRRDTIAPLQDCIRRVYGESYGYAWLYDGDAVAALLDEGRLVNALALDETGQVVGTLGFLLASPRNESGDYTADSVAAMVDPRFRGRDVMVQLGATLFHATKPYALAGVHLYALALHDVVQRRSMERGGAAITGILPANCRGDVRIAGFETGSHRVGAVTLYQPIFPVAPRRSVALPARYADVLRRIYGALPLARELAAPPAPGPEPAPRPERSQCELVVEPANQEGRLRVRRTGDDLGDRLTGWAASAPERGLEVLYLDLALDDAGIQQAVHVANDAGFGFGALLAEREHTDWLRLQAYRDEQVSLDTMVVTGAGRELLRFVEDDMKRVHR